MTDPDAAYQFEPIGFVRSPFTERAQAPRQASVGRDVEGRIELLAGRGYDHALEGRDPLPPWQVAFSDVARAQLEWLGNEGLDLRGAIEAALALGPEPRPYRRIRERGGALELAVKDWRVDFAVELPGQASAGGGARRLLVLGVRSGYRPKDLEAPDGVQLHRQFLLTFPPTAG